MFLKRLPWVLLIALILSPVYVGMIILAPVVIFCVIVFLVVYAIKPSFIQILLNGKSFILEENHE